MTQGYSSSERPASQLIPPGLRAAKSETREDDQEIIITFKLKAHGSADTANGLIQRLRRQLSIMTHRDVELVSYDVQTPGEK